VGAYASNRNRNTPGLCTSISVSFSVSAICRSDQRTRFSTCCRSARSTSPRAVYLCSVAVVVPSLVCYVQSMPNSKCRSPAHFLQPVWPWVTWNPMGARVLKEDGQVGYGAARLMSGSRVGSCLDAQGQRGYVLEIWLRRAVPDGAARRGGFTFHKRIEAKKHPNER
jgi:hypothetical protein